MEERFCANNVNSDDEWQGVPFELTVQTHSSLHSTQVPLTWSTMSFNDLCNIDCSSL
jgi:hypothetical protein